METINEKDDKANTILSSGVASELNKNFNGNKESTEEKKLVDETALPKVGKQEGKYGDIKQAPATSIISNGDIATAAIKEDIVGEKTEIPPSTDNQPNSGNSVKDKELTKKEVTGEEVKEAIPEASSTAAPIVKNSEEAKVNVEKSDTSTKEKVPVAASTFSIAVTNDFRDSHSNPIRPDHNVSVSDGNKINIIQTESKTKSEGTKTEISSTIEVNAVKESKPPPAVVVPSGKKLKLMEGAAIKIQCLYRAYQSNKKSKRRKSKKVTNLRNAVKENNMVLVEDSKLMAATATFIKTQNTKKEAIQDVEFTGNIRDQLYRLTDINTQQDASLVLKNIIVELKPEQFLSLLNILKRYGPMPKLSTDGYVTPSKHLNNGGSSFTGGTRDTDSITIIANNGVRTSGRKEFVKLFSILSIFQPEQSGLHLSRLWSILIPWLSDHEDSVRDTTADVYGDITRIVFPISVSITGMNNLSVLVKSLLQNLTSPLKETQIGSALALARIFANGNQSPERYLSQSLDRIAVPLNNKLKAVRGQAGGAGIWITVANLILSTGNDFLPYIISYLESLLLVCEDPGADWQVIEAALRCSTIISEQYHDSSILYSPVKDHILAGIEKFRYHKINHVREAAIGALTSWRDKVQDGSHIYLPPLLSTSTHTGTLSSSMDMSKIKRYITSPSHSITGRSRKRTISSPSRFSLTSSPIVKGNQRPVSAPIHGRFMDTYKEDMSDTLYEPTVYVPTPPGTTKVDGTKKVQVSKRPPPVIVNKTPVNQFNMNETGGDESLPEGAGLGTSATGTTSAPVIRERPVSTSHLPLNNMSPEVMNALNMLVDSHKKILSEVQDLKARTVTKLHDFDLRLASMEKSIVTKKGWSPRTSGLQTIDHIKVPPLIQQVNHNATPAGNIKSNPVSNLVDNMNVLFDKVLKSNNDIQLIQLITRTGPCLDRLDINTQKLIWTVLVKMLHEFKYIDQIFPWVRQQATLIKIDKEGQSSDRQLYNDIANVLYSLAASPNDTGVEAARLHVSFSRK